MSDRIFHQNDNSNILVIAWGNDGQILKASAHHDMQAANAKAKACLEDEDTAHVVKYYAKFKPGRQPETVLVPYGWFEIEEQS
jgi:hypothetical protein